MARNLQTYTEALASVEQQSPETVDSRHGSVSYRVGGTQREQPPEDVLTNIETYLSVPQLFKGVNKFAADVVAPGWRVEADSSETTDELEEWGESAGIIGGETHKDVQDVARQAAVLHQVTGNITTEHVKPDPETEEITGMGNVPVESLYPQTEPGKSVLISPDDTERDDVVLTARGEAAAYIQWHQKSALGQRNRIGSDRTEIPLSQNDITKTANNPGPSDIWGRSPLSTVTDRVEGLKRKLGDNEEAIAGKAYGIWTVGFNRDVIDVDGSPTEIIEFSESDQDDFMDELGDMEPGDIIGHDGTVEFERHEGEVADILDYLLFDLDYIVTALAIPKYAVGHGEDITQHVTERQAENYEEKLRDMRQVLEKHFTPIFKKRAEQQGLDTSGLRWVLEPQEDESPVTSLTTEEIENIKTYTEALQNVSPSGDPLDVINEDSLRDLVLQLPDDAAPNDDEGAELDEADPSVVEQFEQQFSGDGEQPALADGGEEPPDDGGEGGES